jgi:hypothetical protein
MVADFGMLGRLIPAVRTTLLPQPSRPFRWVATNPTGASHYPE